MVVERGCRAIGRLILRERGVGAKDQLTWHQKRKTIEQVIVRDKESTAQLEGSGATQASWWGGAAEIQN